jgi:cell division septation protein DedD
MRRTIVISAGAWLIIAAFGVAAQERRTTKQAAAPAQTPAPSTKSDYPLTPKNGPWMVMVKSFQGPEAVLYANNLAAELRTKHKIVAYTFVKLPDESPVQQVGYVRGRTRQQPSAAVLAGDCKNEKAAMKLRDQIRQIRPATITQDMVPDYEWDLHAGGKRVATKNDGDDTPYQWTNGVLRTAFCLPNPLDKTPSELDKKSRDLLRKMNAGEFSVYRCPGEYTLEVGMFTGGIAFTASQAERMEKTSLLKSAGEHAEQITAALRREGIEAYVFHSMTYSLVTVGNFSTTQDPQILQLAQQVANKKIHAWKDKKGETVTEFWLTNNPRIIQAPKQP